MLELIVIYVLCKKIGEILRGKGRNPLGYQVLTVLLWFGGEIAGAFVGILVEAIRQGGAVEGGLNLFVYLFALGGAAVGAAISLAIALLMPAAGDG
jgi:hypothetical protein